jgi:O-antigen ligase
LNLGIVGTVFFLIFLWRGLTHCLYKAEHIKEKEDLWPLAFLVFFIVHNFAECTIVWQNCLEWALCVATVMASDPQVESILNSEEQPNVLAAAPSYQYAFDSESGSDDDSSSLDQFAPDR